MLAISCLCSGDGAADLVGRRFGGPPPPPPPSDESSARRSTTTTKEGKRIGGRGRLPWCPQKSWAGTGGFVCAALVTSYAFARLFQGRGWPSFPNPPAGGDLWARVVGTAVASAAAESLPGVAEGWDNLLVFAAALAADRALCRRRGLAL